VFSALQSMCEQFCREVVPSSIRVNLSLVFIPPERNPYASALKFETSGLDPFRVTSSSLPFLVTIGRRTSSNIYIADPWHPLLPPRLNERTKSPSGGRWLIGSPSGSNTTFATPLLLEKLPFHLATLRLSPRTFNAWVQGKANATYRFSFEREVV